ncbi:MAG: hypothetical protein Q9195_000706 [Heterodermia aff. obscurata]
MTEAEEEVVGMEAEGEVMSEEVKEADIKQVTVAIHPESTEKQTINMPSYSGYPANGLQPAPNFGGQHPSQHYDQGSPPPRAHNPRHASSQGLANQPIVMPPIRVGRDGRGGILRTQAAPPNPASQFNQRPPVYNSYQEQSPHPFQMNQYDAPNPFPNSRGRGHKRGHSDAFNKTRHTKPAGQVAPAVPSFGNPLPGELLSRPQSQGISSDATKKPKKKKRRRHNQLGLTPKTEEHESSSEEEDDQDEEMKLAAAVGAAAQQIRFEYNGQTSTLQSSSEIAAWIAERKKRFPTKARAAEAAERKKQNEEARRLARQAAKESQEKRRAEAREEQEQRKAEAKEKKTKQRDAAKPREVKLEEREAAQEKPDLKDEAALKARLRVEKLRRRLEKEEKRAAKAEAKASRSNVGGPMPTGSSELAQSPNNKKRKRTDSLESSDSKDRKLRESIFKTEATEPTQHVDWLSLETDLDVPVPEESKTALETTDSPLSASKQAPDTAQNPLTPTSQPSVPDIDHSAPPLTLSNDVAATTAPDDAAIPKTIHVERATEADSSDSDLSLSESSSDISSSDSDSDNDDATSSSGSSSSSSDSDAAPESHPIKEHNPPRVPAPKRKKAKNRDICRQFLKNGRCPRGEKCPYRHELPEKGSMSKTDRKAARESRVAGGKKERRKGLYQRLVEQEKEQAALLGDGGLDPGEGAR